MIYWRTALYHLAISVFCPSNLITLNVTVFKDLYHVPIVLIRRPKYLNLFLFTDETKVSCMKNLALVTQYSCLFLPSNQPQESIIWSNWPLLLKNWVNFFSKISSFLLDFTNSTMFLDRRERQFYPHRILDHTPWLKRWDVLPYSGWKYMTSLGLPK